jgi:hypothetical protein
MYLNEANSEFGDRQRKRRSREGAIAAISYELTS